jgi:hypothetical protein
MIYGPRVQFGDSLPDMMRPVKPMTSTKQRKLERTTILETLGSMYRESKDLLKPPTTSGVAIPHRRRIACQEWKMVVAEKSRTNTAAAVIEGS